MSQRLLVLLGQKFASNRLDVGRLRRELALHGALAVPSGRNRLSLCATCSGQWSSKEIVLLTYAAPGLLPVGYD
jgi:hypothetical protein